LVELGRSFTVFEAVRKYAECKGLNPRGRLVTRLAVREYTRKLWDIGDPATVVFLLEFDSEVH